MPTRPRSRSNPSMPTLQDNASRARGGVARQGPDAAFVHAAAPHTHNQASLRPPLLPRATSSLTQFKVSSSEVGFCVTHGPIADESAIVWLEPAREGHPMRKDHPSEGESAVEPNCEGAGNRRNARSSVSESRLIHNHVGPLPAHNLCCPATCDQIRASSRKLRPDSAGVGRIPAAIWPNFDPR